MSSLAEFDAIRPYSDAELPLAVDHLLGDRQFRALVRGAVPWLPYGAVCRLLRLSLTGVTTTMGFQGRLMRPLARYILWRHSKGCSFVNAAPLSWDRRYTFISNHRDIVLDAAFLNLLLFERHAPATCQIAIGDNLLVYEWVKTLVRINKSFIVQRSLPRHELLAAARRQSQYMLFALTTLRENIWIAQREGRAKDSADRTQESVLKMMTLYDDTLSPCAALRQMNIIPTTISYEYDPCDFLKAAEFQRKRDDATYKKSRQDDITNMRTGIFGEKGRIVYHTAASINTWLDEYSGMEHNAFFSAVAQRLDHTLHQHYTLFPNNYLAADLLAGTRDNSDHYTARDERQFERYLCRQLSKITIPNKDEAFLRERLLTMYANPLRNYRAAHDNQ